MPAPLKSPIISRWGKGPNFCIKAVALVYSVSRFLISSPPSFIDVSSINSLARSSAPRADPSPANTDPETATDAVWHNLIHGGITSPPNSWQTPELEPGAQYYWEVRPRVQGDGTPVDWSKTFEFRTSPPPATKSVSGLAEVLDQN